jgi:glucose/mannose-6-phosphate isomerase
VDLDSIDEIKKVDTKKMLDILEKFPEQIREGIEIGKNANINISFGGKNVVIAGMGGSAISGEIIATMMRDECPLPVVVVKDYVLPSFVNEDSLFIAISYSGNTDETLSCFLQALKKKCTIISISSGGRLEEMAKKSDYHITIPPNMQPRAAIAYLLFPLIIVLQRLYLINKCDFGDIIKKACILRERIKADVKIEKNEAKQIASNINGVPILYASDYLAPIARRWRQQFNENAKIMAFDFILPEANHNEIMAWEHEIKEEYTCIFLRTKNQDEKIKRRLDFLKRVYAKKAHTIEVFMEGKSNVAQLIHALYMGDYISIYIALLREVDPTPVSFIQKFKLK